MRFTDIAAQSLLVAYALASPMGSPVEAEKRAVTKTTSCSQISTMPSPVGYICGQEGHIERVGTTLFSWAAGAAVTDCQNECLATAECLTYSWNNTEHMCRYYNKTIRGSNFKVGNTDTFFWNKHCFMKSCKVSTSTLPTPAKTTKSTTAKISSSTSKSSSSSHARATTSTSAMSTSRSSSKSSSSSHTSPSSSSTHTTTTKAATTSTKNAATPKTKTKKASTTTTSKAAAATCAVPSLDASSCETISESLTGEVLNYGLYYSGSGFTENPNNPGNDGIVGLVAETVTFPNTQTACQAAQNCAEHATLLGLLNLFMSYDLHFVKSSCEWECNIYGGANTDPSYFSVANSSIAAAFGYSGQITLLDTTITVPSLPVSI